MLLLLLLLLLLRCILLLLQLRLRCVLLLLLLLLLLRLLLLKRVGLVKSGGRNPTRLRLGLQGQQPSREALLTRNISETWQLSVIMKLVHEQIPDARANDRDCSTPLINPQWGWKAVKEGTWPGGAYPL